MLNSNFKDEEQAVEKIKGLLLNKRLLVGKVGAPCQRCRDTFFFSQLSRN